MGVRNEASLTQLQPNESATPSPLRYYDPELQNAINAEPFDGERFERAGKKARQLNAAYLKQVATLADRMSKQTFSLFSNPEKPLFDADLYSFSFGDSLRYSSSKIVRATKATSAEAVFCNFGGDVLHVLTYRHVSALHVNLPPDRWFSWPSSNRRIDSLLADEITAVDPSRMQHAFLFVSGATISIEFERVQWKKQRNPSR